MLARASASEFAPFAAQIIEAAPDLLFVAWAGETAPAMWQALQQQGMFEATTVATGVANQATVPAYGVSITPRRAFVDGVMRPCLMGKGALTVVVASSIVVGGALAGCSSDSPPAELPVEALVAALPTGPEVPEGFQVFEEPRELDRPEEETDPEILDPPGGGLEACQAAIRTAEGGLGDWGVEVLGAAHARYAPTPPASSATTSPDPSEARATTSPNVIVEVWSAGADADLAGILTRADEALDECPSSWTDPDADGLEAGATPVTYPEQGDAHAAVRIEFEMGPDAEPRQKATLVAVADGSYLVSVTALEARGSVDPATIEDIVDTVLTNLREAEPVPRP